MKNEIRKEINELNNAIAYADYGTERTNMEIKRNKLAIELEKIGGKGK